MLQYAEHHQSLSNGHIKTNPESIGKWKRINKMDRCTSILLMDYFEEHSNEPIESFHNKSFEMRQ